MFLVYWGKEKIHAENSHGTFTLKIHTQNHIKIHTQIHSKFHVQKHIKSQAHIDAEHSHLGHLTAKRQRAAVCIGPLRYGLEGQRTVDGCGYLLPTHLPCHLFYITYLPYPPVSILPSYTPAYFPAHLPAYLSATYGGV